MAIKCPGSRLMRQPKPDIFKCPNCGNEVEIWTDEISAVCKYCKKVVTRFQNMRCIEWCKLAKECVGETQFNKYMKNRMLTMKDKLLRFLEEHFGSDTRRINHAKKVLEYAEAILKDEGGDSHIVIPAAILHDVGIKESVDEHDKIGEKIAEKALLKLGFQKNHIDEICRIIANHHSPHDNDSINFKIVYDADRIVNLRGEISGKNKNYIEKKINDSFLTSTGKKLAKKIYL